MVQYQQHLFICKRISLFIEPEFYHDDQKHGKWTQFWAGESNATTLINRLSWPYGNHAKTFSVWTVPTAVYFSFSCVYKTSQLCVWYISAVYDSFQLWYISAMYDICQLCERFISALCMVHFSYVWYTSALYMIHLSCVWYISALCGFISALYMIHFSSVHDIFQLCVWFISALYDTSLLCPIYFSSVWYISAMYDIR
jgi:hypothetical protein